MPAVRFRIPLSTLTALALLLIPAAVEAQDAPRRSEIRGVVLRGEDRSPVQGATLSLEGTEHQVTSDKNGRFKFPRVPAGQYVVRITVDSLPPTVSTVLVEDRERVQMEFVVGASPQGQVLPDLEVTADAPEMVSKIAEFNKRALDGRGRYFTRPEIEKRDPPDLMTLMRTVPGVNVVCPRTEHRCVLRFRSFNCDPAYFLDGLPSHPSILFLTDPVEVEGIEIYTGPSQTPIEFEGIRARCGAIAIWTRRGTTPSERAAEPPPGR